MYIDVDFEDEQIKILRMEFNIKKEDFFNVIDNLYDNDKNIFCIDFLPKKVLDNEKYYELEDYMLNTFSENTNIYKIFADDVFARKIVNIALNLVVYFPSIVFLEKNEIISNYEINLHKRDFFKFEDLIKFDVGKLKILCKCNNELYLLFGVEGGYSVYVYFSNKYRQI